jgi:tetratricopeptide (TPR) repeat protein
LDYDTLLKTGMVSDFFYNKGLAAAKRNNMTDAVIFLSESLGFDKMNRRARNLLGLCYYNIGKINEALKMWIISAHYYPHDSDTARYLHIVEGNSAQLERMRESAENYNKALVYARQGNEDMAIIRLNKVIDNNPNFVDALNLLALCYIRAKDKNSALQCAERAAAIDTGNTAALRYYKEIVSGGGRLTSGKANFLAEHNSAAYRERFMPKGINADEVRKKTLADGFRVFDFLYLLIGLLIAAGFMYFLAFPAMRDAEQRTAVEAEAKLIERIDELESGISAKQDEIYAATGELERLREVIGGHGADLAAAQSRVIIYRAFTYLLNGQPAAAGSYINTIAAENVPDDVMWIRDRIVNETYPALENQYYNSGRAEFYAGNHDAARSLLEISAGFETIQSNVAHNTLLYLARIALADGDTDKARERFAAIAARYPNTAAADEARDWLSANG